MWNFSGTGRIFSIKGPQTSQNSNGHVTKSVEFQFVEETTYQNRQTGKMVPQQRLSMRVTAWNDLADRVLKAKNGDKAYITGRIDPWAFICSPSNEQNEPNGKRITIPQPGRQNGVLEPHKLPLEPTWNRQFQVVETHQLTAITVNIEGTDSAILADAGVQAVTIENTQTAVANPEDLLASVSGTPQQQHTPTAVPDSAGLGNDQVSPTNVGQDPQPVSIPVSDA